MIVGLKYRICEFQGMCLEDEGDCARVESGKWLSVWSFEFANSTDVIEDEEDVRVESEESKNRIQQMS